MSRAEARRGSSGHRRWSVTDELRGLQRHHAFADAWALKERFERRTWCVTRKEPESGGGREVCQYHELHGSMHCTSTWTQLSRGSWGLPCMSLSPWRLRLRWVRRPHLVLPVLLLVG